MLNGRDVGEIGIVIVVANRNVVVTCFIDLSVPGLALSLALFVIVS